MPDNRYLMRQRVGWYAVVEVPAGLRAQLGRRLKRTLKTADIYVARARRHRAVADMQQAIEDARRQKPGGDPLVAEALAWKASLATSLGSPDQDEAASEAMAIRAEELERQEEGRGVEFAALAQGLTLPIELHTEAWLAEGSLSGRPLAPRSALERRTAVAGLARWLSENNLPVTVEGLSRRLAGRYVSEALNSSGRAPATLAKIIQSLQLYWAWLARRGHVSEETANPWSGQSPRRDRSSATASERAFTVAEVNLLLAHPPSQVMRQFILFAALTGMRREELGLLRVRDCQDGVFIIRAGKTAAAVRRVPIHSLLVPEVAVRVSGKSPDAFLWPDLPGDGKRRTDAIGHAFTRYRRSLGLEDGDQRRSLLNFHSLRRFFDTEAVNAGQPPHLVSLVMGHSEGRKGMTLGRYWSGANDTALRAVVEAVRLGPDQFVHRS